MASAIFVTRFTPSALGHGGEHRAYQVVHDLAAALGREQVVTLTAPPWWQAEFAPRRASGSSALLLLADRVRGFVRRKRRRLAFFAENPLRSVAGTDFTTRGYRHTTFVAEYEKLARSTPRPALCVLEHTGFADLLPINARHDLPTLCCPQNLEALDSAVAAQRKWGRYSLAVDLANEVGVLAQCAERLFISQIEAGLINGLGLASHYYPYLPVGDIHRQFQSIRRARAANPPAPGLYLMLGSAPHASTRAAFEWFVRQAQAHGLPAGARVVVAGIGTEALRPPGEPVPGLEFKGWLQQDALDELLACVTAVLIPQWSGFGALTRISEFACAGIPIIVSRHPTYALDMPPGALVLDDNWADWRLALQRPAGLRGATNEEYAAWEARQPRPLQGLASRALGTGG